MVRLSPRYALKKARDMKWGDFASVLPMAVGALLAALDKKRYSGVWCVSERKDEARDNGYAFFRFMRSEHPEQDCVYFINPKSRDSKKVEALGPVERYGGVRHWQAYFTAPWLVSSQGGAPNGYLGVLLERTGLCSPRHAFLQHGITTNSPEYLLAARNPNRCLFTAGALPEQHFVEAEFGYPEGTVAYTGFARFDALHDAQAQPGRIVVMPTWRKWLRHPSERHVDTESDPASSSYLHAWRNLLGSPRLRQLAEAFHLDIVFYPHSNMRAVMDCSQMCGPCVRYADDDADVQELLKSAQLLITDYSSVFFDMAYMKKPTIFFQFDEAQFRKYHYAQGWFDYHATSFGAWCSDVDSVLNEIERLARAGFPVGDEFAAEHAATFPLYDGRNCERIYEALVDRAGETPRKSAGNEQAQEALPL